MAFRVVGPLPSPARAGRAGGHPGNTYPLAVTRVTGAISISSYSVGSDTADAIDCSTNDEAKTVPDPIWIDTNVLEHALKGDPAVNRQLSAYRKAGRQLLVVPQVANEKLNQTKPKWKAQYQHAMKLAGIEIDFKTGTWTRRQYTGVRPHNVSKSDSLILSQVKAGAEARGIAKPEMITAERGTKAMVAEAHHWGIKSVPMVTPTIKNKEGVLILRDYPADKAGPISRFFKDRPVLSKLGVLGAGIAAQEISSLALSAVQNHFTSVVDDARKEFESKYPDPEKLKAKANLGAYKQAYQSALSQLKNPPRQAKAAAALILALTRDRDLPKVKQYLDDQVAKVQSAADGTISGYSKVAKEYIDAMIGLYNQLNAIEQVPAGQHGLVEIAADVEKRGRVVTDAGVALEEEFTRRLPEVTVFPLAYYAWLDVHTVAEVFLGIGGSVLSFASDIEDRQDAYLRMRKQLDEDLLKVSKELAENAPNFKWD